MTRGWAFALVSVLSVFFLLSPIFVFADSPDVTILPDEKILSVNSSVLIKVDPKTDERPIRVTWAVHDTGSIGLGSFPIVDSKGLCYFSNSDGNATCGPSPFFNAGPTNLYVNVITPSSVMNTTLPLNISTITVPLNGVSRDDNTVYMFFYMGQKAWMKYSIFKEDLSIYQSERPLDYENVQGRYAGNITLNPGVYYFTFVVNDSGTYGSTLKRIEIPSGDYLNFQTSKAEYWKGEKITITGTTSSGSVLGEVDFPDGSKALDFSANAGADHTFSYEFNSESNWAEGEYAVKTSSPLAKSVKFTITEFFEVRPESIAGSVNKSDDFSETIQLKNLGQNTTNVSLSVSGDLKSSYVDIGKTSLGPQEATTISLDILSLDQKVEGKIMVKSGDGLELSIPVLVNVVEPGQVCAGMKALEIEKDTMIISGECMEGEPLYHDITIKNNGGTTLSQFSYDIEDTLTGDQSLQTLDRNGYIDVPVSNLSIGTGESEKVEIQLTPSAAGKYEGIININAGGETAPVFVFLTCYANISGDLSNISSKLAGLGASDTVKSDISSDISNAESALTLGNYAQANEYYQTAQAKIEMLGTGGGGAVFDFTWIIIIVVIAVVGVVFLWFFKLRKPAGGATEEDVDDLEKFA